MRALCATVLLVAALDVCSLADQKPTSLREAQAAIEANLKTPEGKAYEERLGKEFQEKYLGTLRLCKERSAKDVRSFWFLVKIGKDGAVKEVLLYPETAIGICARETMLKDRFSPPPHDDHWVGVYLKLTH